MSNFVLQIGISAFKLVPYEFPVMISKCKALLVYYFSKLFIVNYFLNLGQNLNLENVGIGSSIHNQHLFRCSITFNPNSGKVLIILVLS